MKWHARYFTLQIIGDSKNKRTNSRIKAHGLGCVGDGNCADVGHLLNFANFFFLTHFIVSNGAKFISFAARNVNIFSIWCGTVPKIARHSVNPIMNRIYMKIGGSKNKPKNIRRKKWSTIWLHV